MATTYTAKLVSTNQPCVNTYGETVYKDTINMYHWNDYYDHPGRYDTIKVNPGESYERAIEDYIGTVDSSPQLMLGDS